jgi:predicted transcriptional regulator
MADTKPMSFHIPVDLKRRLTIIAAKHRRSLTQQMIVALEDHAKAEEASGDKAEA